MEEFLQDQSITAADMRSGPIAFCVATAMACFHFSPLILSRCCNTPLPAHNCLEHCLFLSVHNPWGSCVEF